MEDTEDNNISYRLNREMSGISAWLRKRWESRWVRWGMYALLALILCVAIFWLLFVRNLPDAEGLLEYESPLPTVVRDINGEPFHSYARERRVQLEYADFPQPLINAYLAAEDKTFFSHGGIDFPGIASALLNNLTSDGRPVGASTITQQVAKNLLLTNEVSYTRKVKEALLARRIESVLTKQQILSLYLNEIPLGRRAFGVEAAAQAYFDKSVDELELHETAFLAILPKAPERYGRSSNRDSAVSRRNWALGEMRKNGFITPQQLASAKAQPLGLAPQQGPQFGRKPGYFTEEVRRLLMDRFGEKAEDGPYSVYSGGLWVRTSLHPVYQEYTTEALRDGLLRYHAGKGWHGPIATVKAQDGDIFSQFLSSNKEVDYKNWRTAVVVAPRQVKLRSGEEGRLVGGPSSIRVGDIIAVAPSGAGQYAVRIIPEVGGGMVVQNPLNGRVLAVQGGFDSRLSSFNRATQAMRQPGSTIKPFVYATAIDQGMSPSSIILDAPFCVSQSAALGRKCFRNFGGAGGAGPRTMRWGLEQSRNLMTVRAANDAGMDRVTDTFRAMNIGDYKPYLAFALGAGDTTVLKMTNAYSMLVNHGKKLNPTFIDFVQNRRGKVIWPARWKPCKGCNSDDWNGQPMPRFAAAGKQVMDPITAYQVVHMLEGVVQRGTATLLKDLGRPMFGKTGTTTGPTNVWFVGGTANLVSGVYLGYDQPRNMGGYAQGGSTAAPIFKQFARKAVPTLAEKPFVAPAGTRLVRVDRQTGKRVYGNWPGQSLEGSVIWEAFAAQTEPKRTIRREEIAARRKSSSTRAASTSRREQSSSDSGSRPAASAQPVQGASGTKRDQDFLQEEGGIY